MTAKHYDVMNDSREFIASDTKRENFEKTTKWRMGEKSEYKSFVDLKFFRYSFPHWLVASENLRI